MEYVYLGGTELVSKADIIDNNPSYMAGHMTITTIVWVLVVVSATIIGVFYYILPAVFVYGNLDQYITASVAVKFSREFSFT